jgi:hypothetical protein
MLPLAIIKHLDLLEAGHLHFGLRYLAHAVVTLVREAVKPALGRRVVPAIPLRLVEHVIPNSASFP